MIEDLLSLFRRPPLARVLPFAVWAYIFIYLSTHTWGYGPSNFVAFLAAAVFLLILRYPRLYPKFLRPTRDAGPLTGYLFIAIALIMFWSAVIAFTHGMAHPHGEKMFDIGLNTYAAANHFLEGDNPYRSVSQLWHQIPAGPHVSTQNGGILRLFGIPYYYGYPYFPAMFMSYIPAVFIFHTHNALPATNLILLVLNVVGVCLLAFKLGKNRAVSPWMAVAAYLCVSVYSYEIFTLAITDILISTIAVYAFLALAYEKPAAAGALFGLAQACKLLPGPLLFLSALFVIRTGKVRFTMAFFIVSLGMILPFFAADPGAFFSATILYYLVEHAQGDNTSFYFFLPESLRGLFVAAGFILSPAMIPLFARRGSVTSAIAAGFASFLVFIAFGKMTHLNYLWGIWPLGCVALALLSEQLVRERD